MATTVYSSDQFLNNYPPGMRHFYWTKARNRILRQHIAAHPELLPMLEVGCGTGLVTGYMRQAGLDVTGIEIGEPEVDDTARGHVVIGQDALTAAAEFRGRFRSIGLFDVIEHIEDAPAFLRALLNAYQGARYVVITVPAGPELWTNYDGHFGHFRRYTRGILADHLAQSGLRPLHMRNFFHGLYWGMRASIAIGGREHRRTHFHPPLRQPWRMLHAGVAAALDLEQRIMPGNAHGTSILVIAERE